MPLPRSLDRVIRCFDRCIPKSWTPNGVSRFRGWYAVPAACLARHVEGMCFYLVDLEWIWIWAPLTVCICVVACASDALDGYLARIGRHPNTAEEERGPRFDEQTDKLFVFAYIPLVLLIPSWIYDSVEWLIYALPPMVLIFIRDLDITRRRSDGRLPKGLPTQTLAKWKTGVMMVSIVLLTVEHSYTQIVGAILAYLALMCAAISWRGYIMAARRTAEPT